MQQKSKRKKLVTNVVSISMAAMIAASTPATTALVSADENPETGNAALTGLPEENGAIYPSGFDNSADAGAEEKVTSPAQAASDQTASADIGGVTYAPQNKPQSQQSDRSQDNLTGIADASEAADGSDNSEEPEGSGRPAGSEEDSKNLDEPEEHEKAEEQIDGSEEETTANDGIGADNNEVYGHSGEPAGDDDSDLEDNNEETDAQQRTLDQNVNSEPESSDNHFETSDENIKEDYRQNIAVSDGSEQNANVGKSDQGNLANEEESNQEKNTDINEDDAVLEGSDQDAANADEESDNPDEGENAVDEDSNGWIWVDPGRKKTVRESGDQERAILDLYEEETTGEGKTKKPKLNSAGKQVQALSTNKSRNDSSPKLQTIKWASIDGVGKESDKTAKKIQDITGGVCDEAWISPQNFLLYSKDAPEKNIKAGDRIVYTAGDGKNYYLYFTDDVHSDYYDTALVIPEENTVDNVGEGLEIAMVDWGGNASNDGTTSTQDQYIYQQVEAGYKIGTRNQLKYNGQADGAKEVTLHSGYGWTMQSPKGIYVDTNMARYILIPDSDSELPSIEDKNIPLYYYYHIGADTDSFGVFQDNGDDTYTFIGFKSANDIENHNLENANGDDWVIAVTNSDHHGSRTNEKVEYITDEKGVFSDTLGEDGYPTISQGYDRKRKEELSKGTEDPGETSLGKLFDYDTNIGKFNAQVDTQTDAPHWGKMTNRGDGTWDSYFLTNGLLQLDDDGYWVYDSNKNFASLAPYGYGIFDIPVEGQTNQYKTSATNGSTLQFTLFNETGTPNSSENNPDYHKGNFMPYDTLNLKNADSSESEKLKRFVLTRAGSGADYQFGMQVSGNFVQTPGGKMQNGKDMIYEFSGDDDMVVYIDGRLAVDLSGVHDALSGTINFATGEITTQVKVQNAIEHLRFASVIKDQKDTQKKTSLKELGFENLNEDGTFEDGTVHDIKIFYMERGRGASNLKLKVNLPTAPVNTVTSSVKKEWNDGKADHENDSVTMRLQYSTDGGKTYKDYDPDGNPDNGIEGDRILNKDNGWSAYIRRLPRYEGKDDDQKEVLYRWIETNVDPDQYSSSSEMEDKSSEESKKRGIFSYLTTFINTLLGKTTVKQEWNDGDDKFQKRPESVTMILQASTDDGKTYDFTDFDLDPEKEGNQNTSTLSDANQWTMLANLPKFDKNGKKIQYRWIEMPGDEDQKVQKGYGHTSSSEVYNEGTLTQEFKFVNTLWAKASVIKNWEDNDNKNGVRPDSIMLTLHRVNADGTVADVKTAIVKPDENGDWTTSEDVPRFDEEGNPLRYYWTEGEVPEYTQSEYVQYVLGKGDNNQNYETSILSKHEREEKNTLPFVPDGPTLTDFYGSEEPITIAAVKSKPSKPETEELVDSEDEHADDTDVVPSEPEAPAPADDQEKTAEVNPSAPDPIPVVTSDTPAVSVQKEVKGVPTGDMGYIGGNAAMAFLSAVGFGICAFLNRRRKNMK